MNVAKEGSRVESVRRFGFARIVIEDGADENILETLHQRRDVLPPHRCHVDIFVHLQFFVFVALGRATYLVTVAGFFFHA